jgi:diketogulonate reductase-like aldo/keto reductase
MVTTLSRAEFLRLVARGFSSALALNGLADPTAFKSTTALAASENSAMKESKAVHNAGQKAEMITRPIPKSGEKLPVIGLGTWQTFDVGNDAAALASLTEVLRLLFDGGVKVIDSSPMYGRAEAVVGDLLAKMHARERAFLATKVWTSGREEGIAQMRRSAELLKTRVIDLMQIHNLVDWRTQLATLRRMKEAGQVRYIGITHYTPSAFGDLAGIIGREEIDFVQMPYSIDVRDAEKRLLPFAAERRVGVIVNRPFGGGGLFRQVRGKSLPPWATDFGCASWAQFFLKYIVSHPAVTCVIPATAEPAHLGDDLGAGYGRVPDSTERRRMAEYWDSM